MFGKKYEAERVAWHLGDGHGSEGRRLGNGQIVNITSDTHQHAEELEFGTRERHYLDHENR